MPPEKPELMQVTVKFTPAEWYAFMYVATSIKNMSPDAFCKMAVESYVRLHVQQTMQESEPKRRMPDPLGWFNRHTQVGIKRQ